METYMLNKICIKCGKTKPCELFVAYGISAKNDKGYKNVCKECSGEATKLRKVLALDNPKPVDNTCKICGSNEHRLVLDHCHNSKKFRGWICNYCNVALGQFKDNIETLKKAIEYLENGI